jgi:hypothetical protein
MYQKVFSVGFGICSGYLLGRYFNNIKTLYNYFKASPETEHKPVVERHVHASWKVCQVGLEIFRVKIEQFFQKSCVKKGGVYHVSFVIQNKLYKIVIKPPQGPYAVQNIDLYNHLIEQKNAELDPYIRGLQARIELTPKLLGEKMLSLVYPSGKIKEFKENEPIQLTDV